MIIAKVRQTYKRAEKTSVASVNGLQGVRTLDTMFIAVADDCRQRFWRQVPIQSYNTRLMLVDLFNDLPATLVDRTALLVLIYSPYLL